LPYPAQGSVRCGLQEPPQPSVVFRGATACHPADNEIKRLRRKTTAQAAAHHTGRAEQTSASVLESAPIAEDIPAASALFLN